MIFFYQNVVFRKKKLEVNSFIDFIKKKSNNLVSCLTNNDCHQHFVWVFIEIDKIKDKRLD